MRPSDSVLAIYMTRSGRSMRDVVFSWLTKVRHDHQAPDLWGELAKAKAIPDSARAEYAVQFGPDELKLLEGGLADIERYIITTQPVVPHDA